jgi:hypothetical protein
VSDLNGNARPPLKLNGSGITTCPPISAQKRSKTKWYSVPFFLFGNAVFHQVCGGARCQPKNSTPSMSSTRPSALWSHLYGYAFSVRQGLSNPSVSMVNPFFFGNKCRQINGKTVRVRKFGGFDHLFV